MQKSIRIIECPRDAMQGMKDIIPTEVKVQYLNQLLKVGFQTLDCGSFVSPSLILQMADTAQVIRSLDMSDTDTLLSVVVGNKRGAEEASLFDQISYVGYPFSISETFQQRNTNCDLEESLERVEEIMNICDCHGKSFVAYISMAFGNPYGDLYDPALVSHWVDRLVEFGVTRFSISDTIGAATPTLISEVLLPLYEEFPDIGFGCHFHTTPTAWEEKISAALEAGCNRFDGAIKGFGGCPMAKDDLTGNMPTEKLLAYCKENNIESGLDDVAFSEALRLAQNIFK
jgi:hydroxymethylglutaryl-CoA lyase